MAYFELNTELYHHGIKGQKWGQRHYQYEDGSLTAAGKARYGVGNGIIGGPRKRPSISADGDGFGGKKHKNPNDVLADKVRNAGKKVRKDSDSEKNTPEAIAERKEKLKKAAKVGAVVGGTVLAAYGAKKLHDYVRSENNKLAVKAGEEAYKKYVEKNKLVAQKFDSASNSMTWKNRSGTESVFKLNSNGPGSGRREMMNSVHDYNNRVINKGMSERSRTIYEKQNANFKEATKNVINDKLSRAKNKASTNDSVKRINIDRTSVDRIPIERIYPNMEPFIPKKRR